MKPPEPDPETFLKAAQHVDEHSEYACWALACCARGSISVDTYRCPESDCFMSLFDDGTLPDATKMAHGLFGRHLNRDNQELRVIALLLAYQTLTNP